MSAQTRYWAVPATLFLLLCQLGLCWKSLAHPLAGDSDFRAFYTSGHMVARGLGAHLYDYQIQSDLQSKLVSHSGQTLPFLYPAFAALFFVPFSILSYRQAFVLFGVVNLCLLMVAGICMRWHLPLLQKGPVWLPGYLFLGFFPVSMAIMQGQLSFVLLMLYTISFMLQRRHQEFASGLCLAGTLIKFQLALPVALLFLCWRQWRTMAGFALGATTMAVASTAFAGLSGTMQYIHGLLSMTHEGLQNAQAARIRYGMFPGDMPNFHGLFFLITHGSWLGQVLSLFCSAGLMAWAARQRPSFSIALPAAMMISYHMQAYDLTLLLLPLSISLDRFSAIETMGVDRIQAWLLATRRARFVVWTSIVLLLVPAAPFILAKGLCALFAISVLGTLWAGGCAQFHTHDLAKEAASNITAPQPC